jgi:hypothetical protein
VGIDPYELYAALVLAWLAVAALGVAVEAAPAAIDRRKAHVHAPAARPPTPLPH